VWAIIARAKVFGVLIRQIGESAEISSVRQNAPRTRTYQVFLGQSVICCIATANGSGVA
jgi:hypothetical protein